MKKLDNIEIILCYLGLINLLKKPPLHHTLRRPCKFLILAIYYHAKKIPKI